MASLRLERVESGVDGEKDIRRDVGWRSKTAVKSGRCDKHIEDDVPAT